MHYILHGKHWIAPAAAEAGGMHKQLVNSNIGHARVGQRAGVNRVVEYTLRPEYLGVKAYYTVLDHAHDSHGSD